MISQDKSIYVFIGFAFANLIICTFHTFSKQLHIINNKQQEVLLRFEASIGFRIGDYF